MKKAVALITIITTLALSAVMVSAQDVEGVAPDVAIGSFAMTDISGEFAETTDGLFLTINDVAEAVDYVMTTPALYADRYETVNLAGDWSAAPEALTTEAVLVLDDMSITVMLSAPEFVDGNLTFSVEIVEFASDDASFMKSPFAPETFANGSLMIAFSEAFADGIQAGMDARLDGVRGSNVSHCFPKCR